MDDKWQNSYSLTGEVPAEFLVQNSKLVHSLNAGRNFLKRAEDIWRDENSVRRKLLAQKITKLRSRVKKSSHARILKELEDKFSREISHIGNLYRETILRAHSDCLALCVRICQEIIVEDSSKHHEAIAKRIQSAIQALVEPTLLNIRVNSCHQSALIGQFNNTAQSSPSIHIIADDALAPGNAILETESGNLEINWLSQLKSLECQLQAQLIDYLNQHEHSKRS